MMKKQWISCLCFFIITSFAVSGYAKEPLQSLTLQLNWIKGVQFAGILLAQEKGWYQDAGIDLTVKERQKGIAVIDEVVSGNAQIGIIAGSDIIKSKTEGKPVKAFAVQLQKSPYCLISKKDKGIDTPDKLKGKKIGIRSDAGEFMLKIILANQGIKPEDIRLVKIGWDIQPLIDDSADVIQGYMNDEPNVLKDMGYEINYIPAFQCGYDFYGDVYFTTETMIQNHPELVQNFLSATLSGWREAFKNTQSAAQLITEKYLSKESIAAHETESLKIYSLLSTLGEGKKYLGWMEEAYWQKGIDILYNFKQIEKKIPAGDVFTMDFLNAAHFGQ
jgi:ABC-type nitrate/sulfonate/bicarbonate transport system substrate-binding protein